MLLIAVIAMIAGWGASSLQAQTSKPASQSQQARARQLVWIDTDIGDDIDDAFALGLILHSPELRVLGISTAFGDTEMRARLVDRLLSATGASAIPVTAGIHTQTDNLMTQKTYAMQAPARKYADGVAALQAQIRQHPEQVTLIALGPLFNIGALIDRDPYTFRKLKRVVMMGGSIYRGYGGWKGEPASQPAPEWNIDRDPQDAAKLLAAGVPIFLMPLDSTQIRLQTGPREEIFSAGTPLTDQLAVLYHQWMENAANHPSTPTLFDPVAAAYTFRPDLCPTQPMRLEIDDKGSTKPVQGPPNASVCLKSDEDGFLQLLLSRLKAGGN
jgi:purine nucleosidase